MSEKENESTIIKEVIESVIMEKFLLFQFLFDKGLAGEWQKYCAEKEKQNSKYGVNS